MATQKDSQQPRFAVGDDVVWQGGLWRIDNIVRGHPFSGWWWWYECHTYETNGTMRVTCRVPEGELSYLQARILGCDYTVHHEVLSNGLHYCLNCGAYLQFGSPCATHWQGGWNATV